MHNIEDSHPKEQSLYLFRRWLIFIKERFEPVSTSLMILSLVAANATMVWAWDPGQAIFSWKRLAMGYLLIWLVFFHMRLFDEIKDYEEDCRVNLDRPLPRGLLTVGEVGAMTLVCFILEGFIAGGLRHPTFYAWSVVAGFTLIMRVEFFVGDWLSPKMELYGLVHTLSASLIGMLVFSVMTNQSIHLAPLAYIYVVLGNWFVFNVFEIGRKTFGKEEERPSVPSYSTRLKPTGAYLFLAVNILLAFGTLWQACSLIKNVRYPGISVDPFTAMVAAAGGISLMVLIAGALYIQKANAVNGKIYRGVVSLYLLAYHVSIVIIAFIQLR